MQSKESINLSYSFLIQEGKTERVKQESTLNIKKYLKEFPEFRSFNILIYSFFNSQL